MLTPSLTELPYLWHVVPAAMRGTTLWALKALEAAEPELAAAQRAKYAGREHIAKLHVPLLDCKWDEVIFLSPLHPQLIVDGFHAVGGVPRANASFQLPAHVLEGHEAIWFNPAKAARDGTLTPESVSRFHLAEYASKPLSEHALPAYQRSIANGRRPLLLSTELHVLVRGYDRDGIARPLDVIAASIITPQIPSARMARA